MALSGGRLSGSLYILKSGQAEIIMGLFMALFSVVPVFTGLSVGRWIDRVGAAKVMRFGIVFVFLGIMLPVVWLSVTGLLLAAALIGFGFNIVGMSAQNSVGHIQPGALQSQRLANFGWYAIGHSISSTMGPFLAGVLIDFYGYKSAFAVLGCFTLMSLLLVYRYAHRLPQESKLHVQPAEKSNDFAAPNVMDLLRLPSMRRVYWTNVVTASAWDLFLILMPIVGVRMGFSASVIGTVLSCFALGTFSARLAMPWLAKRFTEWQLLRSSLFVVALCFAIMPWANVALLFMGLGFMIGCSLGMSQPNVLSLLHASAPPGRGGEVVGLRSVITNAVSVVTPLAFGGLLAGVSVGTVLWLTAASIALGAIPAHNAATKPNS
jgi:MFS family permease